jgi:predicted ribonuclease YlaK
LSRRRQRKPKSTEYEDRVLTASVEKTFHGIKLSKEQAEFRDAIYNQEKIAVICNAAAGTGKTLVAVAAASILVDRGDYDNIIYVMSPCKEGTQGFLPGTIAQKSQYYSAPLYQALSKIGVRPDFAVRQESFDFENRDDGAFITCMTDTFIRGLTLSRCVVIIDEAQNFDTDQLRTVFTRISDDSKVIIIGHDKQCDLKGRESGFVRMVEHFKGKEWVQICTLTQNFRGQLSQWADKL